MSIEKINSLNNIKNKYNINNSLWSQLLSQSVIKTIKKNNHIVELGTIANELFYIVQGVLRIYHIGLDGNEVTVNFVTDDSFFMANMFPYNKSLTWVDALIKTDYVCLKYDVFEKFAKKYNVLNQIRNEVVNKYHDRNHSRDFELRNKNATERYISFLEEYPNLIDRIPHYYIASYLNISPIQLSRIRRKLKQ